MSILVNHCFHWIGFHLVSHLLEEGWKVDGKSYSSEKIADHFGMFLGRNNNFTLLENKSTITYDTVFTVGMPREQFACKRHIILSDKPPGRTTNKEGDLYVDLPLLFGEWMPMNEQGVYDKNTFIDFSSNYFLKEAVYIKKFVENLVQLMHVSNIPHYLSIKSKQSTARSLRLEKSIYLYNNKTEKHINHVKGHYKDYSYFYEAIY